ncbi:lipase family protein [Novosphingobium sp. P6W]|uniref:lipase family protein n=1 Tax=Novosphingobium sp. P6W TaxID=1609758 RepID=UPI000ABA0018|nr:lipase family protein [Novosphingobium sp. P6W]
MMSVRDTQVPPVRRNPSVRTVALLALLAVLVFVTLSLPGPAMAQRAPQPDPEQGDGRVSAFYDWVKAIPAKPGKLLRSEPLPETVGLSNAARQSRILYTSTSGFDSKTPIVVSGALFVPKGTPPKGGWPVIAWAHGTVGLADICAPSWAGRSYRDTVYLNRWLAEGYAVVATDYQGLGVAGPHPLINIPAISYGVLDSIRAVVNGGLGIANNAVIVGQSQGGAAAFGAASYAPTYAPDIALKGAVGTGVIYNRSPELPTLPPPPVKPNPNVFDEAIVYSLFGFVVAQQFDPTLQFADVFTEKGAVLAKQARTACLFGVEADAAFGQFTRAETFLAKPGERYARFLETADERAARYGRYPTLKLPVPIFIGTGASDLTPSALNQLTLMKDACAAGSVVEGHVYAGLGHSATVNASLRDSIPFVKKAFAGEQITPVCEPHLQ